MTTTRKAPQLGLFGVQELVGAACGALMGAAQEADQTLQALAQSLPSELALGTSSWSFPGWQGLVYEGAHSSAKLSRHGLPAFSKNPLLSSVSIDRGYYAPVPEQDYVHYAAQVPDSFRFVVKAWRELTTPILDGRPNPSFLNPNIARTAVIEVANRGLQTKLDCILFQFSPMHLGQIHGVQGFCERLAQFLSQLPKEVRYAVEVRTPELLGPALCEALATINCTYTINLLPGMPDLDTQFRQMHLIEQPRYLVRWLLAQGHGYQDALEGFAPFNALKVPSDATVLRLAQFVRWAQSKERHFTLQVNNKAEGCAPLTLLRVAKAIARLPG